MFVPSPNHSYARLVESHGQRLRARLRLDVLDRLDPHDLIATFDDIYLYDLRSAGTEFRSALAVLREDSAHWSAIAVRMPGCPWLISWNPWHSDRRVRVSVMEEVAHIVLGHQPTACKPCPLTGLPVREFTASKEKQAYAVAAAAVAPYAGILKLLGEGQSFDDLADHYGVSKQLITFRVNVTRAREALSTPRPAAAVQIPKSPGGRVANKGR